MSSLSQTAPFFSLSLAAATLPANSQPPTHNISTPILPHTRDPIPPHLPTYLIRRSIIVLTHPDPLYPSHYLKTLISLHPPSPRPFSPGPSAPYTRGGRACSCSCECTSSCDPRLLDTLPADAQAHAHTHGNTTACPAFADEHHPYAASAAAEEHAFNCQLIPLSDTTATTSGGGVGGGTGAQPLGGVYAEKFLGGRVLDRRCCMRRDQGDSFVSIVLLVLLGSVIFSGRG